MLFGVCWEGIELLLTIDNPVVHFVEVFRAFGDVQRFMMNVVLGPEENAYRGFYRLLGVDGEMEAEGLVIKTILTDFDQCLLDFLHVIDHQTVADRAVELIEVGDQLIHDQGLDL